MRAVVSIPHPLKAGVRLFVNAKREPDGFEVIWAYVKSPKGRNRKWIGVSDFNEGIRKAGFDPVETRISIEEELENE